jgi:ubiquinone/menaquinone biosynthesis C-methylase UbiE
VIVSSQVLYCLPEEKLNDVLEEIHRVLTESGRLVFFESMVFMNWNIMEVKDFFDEKGYSTNIIPLNYLSNKCIFIAQQQ